MSGSASAVVGTGIPVNIGTYGRDSGTKNMYRHAALAVTTSGSTATATVVFPAKTVTNATASATASGTTTIFTVAAISAMASTGVSIVTFTITTGVAVALLNSGAAVVSADYY